MVRAPRYGYSNPWLTQAMSENLPPGAGYGDIYDKMGETNRRNRGLGGLIRRVNPFDNAQPPPPASTSCRVRQ